jgi:hypothetical protein
MKSRQMSCGVWFYEIWFFVPTLLVKKRESTKPCDVSCCYAIND